MNARLLHVCLAASLLFTVSPFAQAQTALPVPVPAGTTVMPLRYAEDNDWRVFGAKTRAAYLSALQ